MRCIFTFVLSAFFSMSVCSGQQVPGTTLPNTPAPQARSDASPQQESLSDAARKMHKSQNAEVRDRGFREL
jgi:hypothetical protein